MPRRLLILNVLLLGASLACAAFIVWELVAPVPTRRPPPRRVAALAGTPALAPPRPRAPAAAYNVVATKNLFSPTRTEAPTAGTAGGPAAPVAKPNLYGVVLRDQNPIAYLEDPLTKRVAGYRVGDAIAGGTLKTIANDRVVIARPDGAIDVKLRDPSKPRPPAPPAGAPGVLPFGAAPGTAPQVGAPAIPPTVPVPFPGVSPGLPAVPPQLQPPPGALGAAVNPFLLPGRRGLPSLGGRLPAQPSSQAPAPGGPQR